MSAIKSLKQRVKPLSFYLKDKTNFTKGTNDDGVTNPFGQKTVGVDLKDDKLKAIEEEIETGGEFTGDLDDIDDGTTYKKTTEDEKTGANRAYSALNEGGLLISGIQFESEDKILVEEMYDGINKANTGLDADGYVSLGVKSGSTVKSATTIVSELTKTATALDASGRLQSGIISKLGAKTADDIIGYDTSNLILNPLFKESDTNWINPDTTKNTIVDSFVEFLDKGSEYIITPKAISYDSGNKEYSISCSWVTEIDDALSDGNAYIRFEGDPTSALEGVVARVTGTGTGVIKVQSIKQFTSINNAEKFKIGFKSARSDKALKIFGTSSSMKSEPVPIKSNDDINLSLSFDFYFDDDFPSSRSLRVRVWVLDGLGKKMFNQTVASLGKSSYAYGCYRTHYVTLQIPFTDLTSQPFYQDDGFVVEDISYLQIEVQSVNPDSVGSVYFTGLQVNYGDAVYVEPKDTKLSSSNITKTLNYVFSNASAVDNIKAGKKPDGKFVSPKNNYSALIVTMDINKASTETEFTILESDIRDEIGSNIKLDTDDRVIDAIMQVKIDKGSDMFDIVDSTKDISVKYSTYNKVTVLNKIVVANCPTTEEDYRVTFTCNLQNCPS